MFPVGMFSAGLFPPTMFPPGGSVAQILPVVPLPSVGGFKTPSDKEDIHLDSYELEDERIVLAMIKEFLKGQN